MTSVTFVADVGDQLANIMLLWNASVSSATHRIELCALCSGIGLNRII